MPWRAALEDVLKVGYGVENQSRYIAGSWQRVRRLTTPSAGALYPFEVFAAVVGEGSYLWDVDKARFVPCGLDPMTHEDLAAAGLTAPPGQRLEALLILVARPWLSMKKYYQRGYAYCHLDVGHLATNLAIYTAALGHDSTLHLRFSHAAMAEHLRLGGLCREPLAVLSFAAARPTACPEPAAGLAALAGVEPAALELPGELELGCWELSLRGILPFDFPAVPCPPASAPLLVEPAEVPEEAILPLPLGRAQPSAARNGARRSSAGARPEGFRDEPLSASHSASCSARCATRASPRTSPGTPRRGSACAWWPGTSKGSKGSSPTLRAATPCTGSPSDGAPPFSPGAPPPPLCTASRSPGPRSGLGRATRVCHLMTARGTRPSPSCTSRPRSSPSASIWPPPASAPWA